MSACAAEFVVCRERRESSLLTTYWSDENVLTCRLTSFLTYFADTVFPQTEINTLLAGAPLLLLYYSHA